MPQSNQEPQRARDSHTGRQRAIASNRQLQRKTGSKKKDTEPQKEAEKKHKETEKDIHPQGKIESQRESHRESHRESPRAKDYTRRAPHTE